MNELTLTPNPGVRRSDQQREQIQLVPLPAFLGVGRHCVRGKGDVELDGRRSGLRIPVARARGQEPQAGAERGSERNVNNGGPEPRRICSSIGPTGC